MRQREGMEELRHGQGGQLAELGLQHRPQAETQTVKPSDSLIREQQRVPSLQHTPGDEHLLLDVSQKRGVVLTGEVQTLAMETQDLQTVQHVEQDVGLLKL